jgi:hypothetical protein
MSRRENPLWGAPRIHGELLMLGIEMAQSTVANYMDKLRGLTSQGWKTFLCNHAAAVASLDSFRGTDDHLQTSLRVGNPRSWSQTAGRGQCHFPIQPPSGLPDR